MNRNILGVKNISKAFPGVKALDDVSFCVKNGEVHGLVGENGAGKSTIIKILAGIYTEYEGCIYLLDEKFKCKSPSDALNYGISTIFQELTIINNLSVAENIFLGREISSSKVFLNKNFIYKKSSEVLKFLECDLKPQQKMEGKSIAVQQLVEICKGLVLDAKIIIMDEPTASLTKNEVEHLFTIIRKLKNNGKTIIYVSHKIEEVLEICDSITVLRDGKHIDTIKKEKTNYGQIIKMIVGRSVNNTYPKRGLNKDNIKDNIILSVKKLTKKGEFKNISFDLYKGEIIGFAGLIGAGRTELAKAIAGISKPDSGEIFLYGEKIDFFPHTKEAIDKGLSYLPEDRRDESLFPKMDVSKNISISIISKLAYLKTLISSKKEVALVNYFIEKIKIRTSGLNQKIENLSGGNQQKAIISRILATKSKIIIFDEPTRGIDVGSKFEIYNIINDLSKKGIGIIFISSELQELIGMSDRLILIKDGILIEDIINKNINVSKIMENLIRGKIYEKKF